MRQRVRLSLLVLALVGAFFLGDAQAPCTVSVRPGSSVQSAIDSAPPGAVICLPPGTWEENLLIGKSLTLRGAGPGQTKLVARASGLPGIRVAGLAPVDVVIEALTVEGGRFAAPHENHGILVQGKARLVLTDCVVQGNEWHGVLIQDEAEVSLTRCRLAGNWMYGIGIDGGAGVVLSACTIEGNGSHGIGILAPCPVTVRDSVVRGNGSHGIAVAGGSSAVTVMGCTVERNSWSGVQIGGSVQIALWGSTIRFNGEYGVVLHEAPCASTDAHFEGRVTGGKNAVPSPGSAGGNGLGAVCPAELWFLLTEAGGALDRRR